MMKGSRLIRKYFFGIFILTLCAIGFIKVKVFASSSIILDSTINDVIIRQYKHRIKELETQLDNAMLNPAKSTHLHPEESQETNATCQDKFLKTFLEEERFMCIPSHSGLGNAMFSFASIYGMAVISNKTVLIDKNNQLINKFHFNAIVIDNMCVCESATVIPEKQHCAFDRTMLGLRGQKNYFPRYYFQSWKYFQHVMGDVRGQFRFTTGIVRNADFLIETAQHKFEETKPNSTKKITKTVLVGVHVRRGDITKQERFIKYGYLTAPVQYFIHAMKYFRDKFHSVLFLVCSDDLAWSRKNIYGSDVIFMEGNDQATDMAILSHCDHVIMSVGTFGWWAAFLNTGEIIYYKNPVKNGSALRKHFSDDFSDYFLPEWIGME